jgi:hypothetical protein
MSEEKPKNLGGRPPHEPDARTRTQVKLLSAMGISQEEIAVVMQITRPTLRRHYRSELTTGHIEANAKVAGQIFKMATDSAKPNVAAAIFWLKCQAGWREADQRPVFVEEAKPPKLGKKEAAQQAAGTAQVGTSWEQLLAPDPRRLPN